MIFVALGTQKFQFNRLLQMIDQLLADGKIAEPDDVTDFDKVHEILQNEREKSVQYMNMVLDELK